MNIPETRTCAETAVGVIYLKCLLGHCRLICKYSNILVNSLSVKVENVLMCVIYVVCF